MSHWVGSLTVVLVVLVTFASAMMGTSQEDFKAETLDLAKEAFDDQYLGCQWDMERRLEKDDVLNIEIEKNKKLKRAWREAQASWMMRKSNMKEELPQGFEDNHGIALLTYTGFIRKDFNDAVKWAGKSYESYRDHFNFKWLHFYLTSALQLLRQSNLFSEYTVYGGIDDNIEVPPNGKIYMKFGHFFYTSLNKEQATIIGNTSLLMIDKYPGVNIQKFSQFGFEREVLVPGFEVFSLSPTEEEDRFKLNTTGKFCSNFNCAYINGENSRLSVQDCVNSAASFHRRHGSIPSALITVLLVIVVNILSHIV